MCTHKHIHRPKTVTIILYKRESGKSLIIYSQIKDFGYFKLQLNLFHSLFEITQKYRHKNR